MKITVIICTYNRCRTVTESLDSVAAQNMPDSAEWEVIVVDNNSTDETQQVLAEYCRRHPRFRCIFEAKQGLSHARNAGIANATGDILAFTDDDVIADPDWLRNLTGALHDGEWDGAGGHIIPVWPGELPKWLSKEDFLILGPFTGFDKGPIPCELNCEPYGGNAAFRRELFERCGVFRIDLGRNNKNLLGHEDLDLGKRFRAAGARLRYEPNAIIRHPVPKGRMSKQYVLRWTYWDTRSELAEGRSARQPFAVAGVPLGHFRRLVRWTLQWLISGNAQQRFFCERKIWILFGSIAAGYHSWTSRSSGNAVSNVSVG